MFFITGFIKCIKCVHRAFKSLKLTNLFDLILNYNTSISFTLGMAVASQCTVNFVVDIYHSFIYFLCF